jgi:outer membrane protein assembly factor BamB
MKIIKFTWLILILLISASPLLGQLLSNENWPRFRGPNGQGVAAGTSVPVKWDEKDLAWKIKLPGKGHSSPVIWQDTIYVTSADNANNTGYLSAVSINDGTVLWQKLFQLISYEMHPDNSQASATPAVDTDHVYIIWYAPEKTGVVALDHSGREVWRENLGGVHSRHGPACSPVIVDETLVFTMQQEGESPFPSTWVGLDCQTGNVKWTLQRETGEQNSVSTPCLIAYNDGQTILLFTSESHGFTGVDPETGRVIWEYKKAFNHRTVASPVFWNDIVIASCKQKLVAIEVPRHDNNDSATIRYELKQNVTPYVPTPIVVDDLLFLFLDTGTIACFRASDGQLLWKEKPSGKFYGSPILAGGNLYAVTMEGEVVVIKASGEYQLLAVNNLGEESYATPAVSGNRLIFRTFSYLMAVNGNN